MKRRIEYKRVQVEGRKVWEWWIKQGRKILFGGMCATKKDAENDVRVMMENEKLTNPAAE